MEKTKPGFRPDLHQNILKQHLEKIITNESIALKLKNQENECRERFINCLEVLLMHGDAESTYSFITSPVFSSFLARWGYPGMKRMSCSENRFDLYELQSIAVWQNTHIEKEKKRICEMRNCFQILLSLLAKDEKDNDVLARCHSIVEANVSKHSSPPVDQELKDLRIRVNQLEEMQQKCTKEHLGEDTKGPVHNTYNIWQPKTVFIGSTKNVVGISSSGSRPSSSVGIISSTNSSFRISKADNKEHSHHRMDVLKIVDGQSDGSSGSGNTTIKSEHLQIKLLKPAKTREWTERSMKNGQHNVHDVHPQDDHRTACEPILETQDFRSVKQYTPLSDDRVDGEQGISTIHSVELRTVCKPSIQAKDVVTEDLSTALSDDHDVGELIEEHTDCKPILETGDVLRANQSTPVNDTRVLGEQVEQNLVSKSTLEAEDVLAVNQCMPLNHDRVVAEKPKPEMTLCQTHHVNKRVTTQMDKQICHRSDGMISLLFKGFCDFRHANGNMKHLDLKSIPKSFREVLQRIKTLCEGNYEALYNEMDIHTEDIKGDSFQMDDLEVLNENLQIWLRRQESDKSRTTSPNMKFANILKRLQTST